MEEAFNVPPETPSPPVSPFLAMATSPRFSPRWLVGIGGGMILILGLIIFSLLCTGSFSLPKNTIFLATISPKTANRLFTREQQTTLPIEWQQSFAQNSRWPVLVGLTRTEERMGAFVIGPRWSVPFDVTLPQRTQALIRQTGGLSTDTAAERIIYRERFFSAVFSRGDLQGWIDPAPLQGVASSSNRIVFSFQNGQLQASDTDTATTHQEAVTTVPPPSAHLLDADIALHLSALQASGSAEELLFQLPLEPLYPALSSLEAFPSALQIKLTSSTIQAAHLTFEQALSVKDRAVLQATLEHTSKKRLLTLPDGTVSTETISVTTETPSSSSSSLEKPSTSFDWTMMNRTALKAVAPCGTGTWVARFSPDALTRLTPTRSPLNAWVPARALQIWRTPEGFTVCQEK